MASRFLLTLKLSKQGDVKGSSTRKEGDLDFSKGLECHGLDYSVVSPHDAMSGLPTGQRQHKPITIRREVDAASPKLLSALATNETFTSAKLQFDRAGSGVQTIELTNGRIAKIKPVANSAGDKLEDITLVYDRVSVNSVRDGVIPHSLLGLT